MMAEADNTFIENTKSEEPIDLIQTSPNSPTRAYIYTLVGGVHDGKKVTILAVCATSARFAMNQHFKNETARYMGVCEIIIQVNG